MTPKTNHRRRISLKEMINFDFLHMHWLLHDLFVEQAHYEGRASDDLVPDEDKTKFALILSDIRVQCAQLELGSGFRRAARFLGKLQKDMKVHEYLAQVSTLRELIHDDLDEEYFFHYPREKAWLVQRFDHEWAQVISAFPRAKDDAFSAVDCWAMGHNTACVFHLMRVAEHGLRALGRERHVRIKKKPLEWAEWKNIIDQIREKLGPITKWTRGARRDQALQFYEGALGEFEAFREVYRNDVMHARKSYDEPQATSVLRHVHEFMSRLSSKIDENTKRSIRWKKEALHG